MEGLKARGKELGQVQFQKKNPKLVEAALQATALQWEKLLCGIRTANPSNTFELADI